MELTMKLATKTKVSSQEFDAMLQRKREVLNKVAALCEGTVQYGETLSFFVVDITLPDENLEAFQEFYR